VLVIGIKKKYGVRTPKNKKTPHWWQTKKATGCFAPENSGEKGGTANGKEGDLDTLDDLSKG